MTTQTAVRRFAIVGPSVESLLHLRAPLVRALTSQRHKVLCLIPAVSKDEAAAIEALGVEWQTYNPDVTGVPFLAARRSVSGLAAVLKDWRAQIVLAYGLTTVSIAAPAARKAGAARIISLITGLPAGDFDPSDVRLSPRRLKAAFAASDALVFHNHDDPQRLASLGLIADAASSIVVSGAGVDLDRNEPAPLPDVGPGLVYLMIAPLEHARGVSDYVMAASELKPRAPGARFLLAGPEGRSNDAISIEKIRENGDIEYLGSADDARPLLTQCHVFVYPSHAEGMPRAVLEALAAGRPVITTNAPGCRETVDEHVNGWLVPSGDSRALADAMESYLKRPDLIPAAARASRSKAERKFAEQDVLKDLMRVLDVA